MKPLGPAPFLMLAAAAALFAVPISGLPGGSAPAPMRISVEVRPSASVSLHSTQDVPDRPDLIRLQNAADVAPDLRGFSDMSGSAVLIVNSPPVRPNVFVEISSDFAAPMSKITGELSAEVGGRDSEGGAKLLSLRDLGVAPPPPAGRYEGSDLKVAFERAASELIYRLDLLRKAKGTRHVPVIVSVNL
jgi:hypothetical protein